MVAALQTGRILPPTARNRFVFPVAARARDLLFSRRMWRWVGVMILAACSFDVQGVGGLANDSPDLAGPSGTGPLPPAISITPDLAAPFDVGDKCSPMNPCLAGEMCAPKIGDKDIMGGYCTLDCRTAACPSGSICSGSDSHQCLVLCPTGGCGAGLSCCTNGYPAPGVCVPDGFCN